MGIGDWGLGIGDWGLANTQNPKPQTPFKIYKYYFFIFNFNKKISNKMSNTNSKEPEYITKVSVEQFPSRVELYSFLDSFLEKNNFKKDYTSENKDNLIIFSFKNPVS